MYSVANRICYIRRGSPTLVSVALRIVLASAQLGCERPYRQSWAQCNAVHVEIGCAHVSTVFCGFGVRGLPAERVAGRVAEDVVRYLDAVALDPHLADQVLLPLALSAGGHFSTLKPSGHTETNAAVLKSFLPIHMRSSRSAPAAGDHAATAIDSGCSLAHRILRRASR